MSNNYFFSWTKVNKDDWNFSMDKLFCSFIVYELTMLPNFSEPRFHDLGEKLDERKNKIVSKQMQMLRQLHGLNSFCKNIGIALRIRRDEKKIRLFVVVRISKTERITDKDLNRLADQIRNMIPHEYNFHRIFPDKHKRRWELALDITWANYCDEIFKNEDVLKANTLPFFYISNLWQPVSNDMERICLSMLQADTDAMVDIVLIPTSFNTEERDWVDMMVKRLKEAQMGERIYSKKDHKLLKAFEPIPGLRSFTDNYDKLIKRYDQSRLFLSAFRVFSSESQIEITQALIAGSTRSKVQIKKLDTNDTLFTKQINAARNVDIVPKIHTDFWDGNKDTRPFRAQRLHRLVDLEEVTSFWRFPIPGKAGFAGFDIDTGLNKFKNKSSNKSRQLELGLFSDTPTNSKMKAKIEVQQLSKHGLIIGVPGSGKTTTMFSILHQLWQSEGEEKVPFMVLEPAKTEFRALKNIDTFKDDMLIFTLGDERVSPFRFNPFKVLEGVPLESHISRLNACFMGAFNLFDPLPMLLDKAIRQTYIKKGWFDDSVGGEKGHETPTLTDLCREAKSVVNSSGYSNKFRDDFNASLLQRLESLRRGSKGRMLDTNDSISFNELMEKPVVLELDSLNENEKALLMMFILTFVYEYGKVNRKSGSPLKHVLVIEEAHNLIGRGDKTSNGYTANPKEQSIRLFVRMLAEMRALGQGILIADQLPTAIASEAIKQTNLKILMRLTSKDDREEIGNTMDLTDAQLKDVVHFKSGQSYIYLENWDRVRQVQMENFKGKYKVEEPQDDNELKEDMLFYEKSAPSIFMPFKECIKHCKICNRRSRSQGESFVQSLFSKENPDSYYNKVKQQQEFSNKTDIETYSLCGYFYLRVKAEYIRLKKRYNEVHNKFPFCAYVHMKNLVAHEMSKCNDKKKCQCIERENHYYEIFINLGKTL